MSAGLTPQRVATFSRQGFPVGTRPADTAPLSSLAAPLACAEGSPAMDTPKITAWLKTSCGWSNGVRAVLKKYNLEYEEKDIIKNPAFRWEMEQKSGQSMQPTLEINGTMLCDISGEELEAWLLQNQMTQPNDARTNVPLNSACTDAEHEAMRSGAPLNFKG
jgi:monothiol glutaredoxin